MGYTSSLRSISITAIVSIIAVVWKVPIIVGLFGRRVRGRSTAGVITFRTALLVRKVVGLAAAKRIRSWLWLMVT